MVGNEEHSASLIGLGCELSVFAVAVAFVMPAYIGKCGQQIVFPEIRNCTFMLICSLADFALGIIRKGIYRRVMAVSDGVQLLALVGILCEYSPAVTGFNHSPLLVVKHIFSFFILPTIAGIQWLQSKGFEMVYSVCTFCIVDIALSEH
ncbi:hypothetical protein, partial [Desulfogranum japonicum]|uniref:hypothetical protein n=1 Tax=Desulfogranum japonicum TaxID=231447 RepID=UPI0013775856